MLLTIMQQMQVEDSKCMSPVFIVKVINLFRYPVNSIKEQEHELSCTLHPSTADRAISSSLGRVVVAENTDLDQNK